MKKSSGKGPALLVWDAEGPPPVGDWTTVLWRKYADITDSTVISITQRVEQEADKSRARYLAWIYDLGETRFSGRSVIDHLALRPGLSYWWMSSLAQKFNISDASLINDAIKALALEELVVTRQAAFIVLISGNRKLAECVKEFCCLKGIGFEFRQTKPIQTRRYHRTIYQVLPHTVKALVYIGWYIFNAIPIFLKKTSAIPVHIGEVLFIDVLVHLDRRAISEGRFLSNYWTALVDFLAESAIKSNWLHVFFRHPGVPSLAQAQRQVERFNATSNGSQFHALVEDCLNGRTLVMLLRDYFTVRRSFARLSGIRGYRPKGSDLNIWPLHSEEWSDSLCGKGAVVNCLRVSLFEEAVGRFPTQRLGVYIAENQPWEMALIYAWKAAGHGTLIGTPHTTVRFWDLRYHFDARCYLRNDDKAFPMPDILAVNGPAAREAVLGSGYPSERITEVEALRFLHLLGPRAGKSATSSTRNVLRILVCGDFLAETNRLILAWLEIAARSLPYDAVYVFKPHPAYPLNSVDYPTLRLEISDTPLPDLLQDCDVVFASNITSAAVDAYCTGVPIVQVLDGSAFNLSPLRAMKGVVYVSTPEELAEALGNCRCLELAENPPYFYLENELPRWRKLLTASGISATSQ